MKKLFFLLLISIPFLFIGCSPDDDAPTPTVIPITSSDTTNSIPSDYLGIWIYNAKLSITGISGGAYQNLLSLKTDSSCKIELTNEEWSYNGSVIPTQYLMYGYIGSCGYPDSSNFTWDPNYSISAINGYQISFSSNDSLVLDSSFTAYKYYYSKTAPSLNNTSTINWKINLTYSYPNDNEVGILIQYGDNINPIKDTIVILANTISYLGSVNINTTIIDPYISISLIDLDSIDNFSSSNTISANSELEILGSGLKSLSGPHILCHGQDSTCISGELLDINKLNEIRWN